MIQQNSSILIDSVSAFDIQSLDPKVEKEKLSIGLIDSIYYKNTASESDKYLITFKLHKADLVNFKSDYELHLVQDNNQDVNILFITFSNFIIDNNNARIRVRKVKGTSMMKATFFFEKKNNVWIFRKKIVSEDIG